MSRAQKQETDQYATLCDNTWAEMIVAMEKPPLKHWFWRAFQGQTEGCLREYEPASKADEINPSQTTKALHPLLQDSDLLIGQ